MKIEVVALGWKRGVEIDSQKTQSVEYEHAESVDYQSYILPKDRPKHLQLVTKNIVSVMVRERRFNYGSPMLCLLRVPPVHGRVLDVLGCTIGLSLLWG